MHDSLKESNEIDNNLYPALLQVFVIILFGYLAGSFQILNKSQSLGLNRFVSTFSLPALLFRNIAMLDFNSVNWLFMASIFLSKLIVFILAIVITMITFKPRNLGLAAVFGIFCTQSNDFALGYPIVNAIYSKTHPDYLHYIYLLAPISLCILNPFGFMLMEVNEIISKEKSNEQKNNIQKSLKKSGHDELIDGQIIDDHEDEDKEDGSPDLSVDIDSVSQNNDETLGFDEKLDHIKNKNQKVLNAAAVAATSSTSSVLNVVTEPISKIQLLKTTIWSTFTNPIVFMTLIGIAANFILKRQIPKLIDPILVSLTNIFSGLALFYLGFTMVGRIKGLKFSSIVIIIILIFSKSLIYPLLNREIILHLTERLGSKLSNNGSVLNPNETDSLSTFGFLYGTFPTAPSLFFYIARFKQIGHEDLISSALVFGTLAR
jgi:predicted permease